MKPKTLSEIILYDMVDLYLEYFDVVRTLREWQEWVMKKSGYHATKKAHIYAFIEEFLKDGRPRAGDK